MIIVYVVLNPKAFLLLRQKEILVCDSPPDITFPLSNFFAQLQGCQEDRAITHHFCMPKYICHGGLRHNQSITFWSINSLPAQLLYADRGVTKQMNAETERCSTQASCPFLWKTQKSWQYTSVLKHIFAHPLMTPSLLQKRTRTNRNIQKCRGADNSNLPWNCTETQGNEFGT